MFNQLRRFKPLRRLRLAAKRSERAHHLNVRWELDRSTLSGIGLYVGIWAGIERMLNQFIVAYHPHRLPTLKTLPKDLLSKVKYLSEVAKDNRMPLEVRNVIADIATDLGRESNYRHHLIHGYGFRKRQLGNVDWTFQWIDFRKGEPELTEKTYSNDEMQTRLRKIGEISRVTAAVLTPILIPQTSSTNRP